MKSILTQRRLFLALPLFCLFFSGCTTPPPTDEDIYTNKELRSFFNTPNDPRRFNLTVYSSKNGPVFSGSKRLHTGQFAITDFVSKRKSTMPIIDIRGRRPDELPALIDTSSRDSWTTIAAAQALFCDPLGPPPFQRFADHLGLKNPGYAVFSSKLRIEDLHIENMIYYVRIPHKTLGPLKRNFALPKPELVLGCDLLKRFAFVQIDWPERRIIFSASKEYPLNESRLLASVSSKRVAGTYAVEALLDGKNTRLIIDSAGDYEIGWATASATNIEQVIIGDLVMCDAEIVSDITPAPGYPELPRIGRRLLSRFSVTFDNTNKKIIFERPKQK